MTTKYFALLTNQGAAKLANAAALGTKVNITQMAVGDGGGVLPTPDPAQTKLIGEKRRASLNSLTIDAANGSQIIAEQIIPEGEGGFWIREIGLFDEDGVMIAVANCAETYKPMLAEGSGRTQTVRMIIIVNSTSAVTLKIDPSVVLATRKYVDDGVIVAKQYADTLHTQAKEYADTQMAQAKKYGDDKLKTHTDAADPHKQYLLAVDDRVKYGAMMIGVPFLWTLDVMPHEIWTDMKQVFIPYQGQTFDGTKFPLLAKMHPALKLPVDPRGLFPRIWDNGAGVDAARALLSVQGDAIRNIVGTFGNLAYESLSAANNTTGTGSGVFRRMRGSDANGYVTSMYSTANVGTVTQTDAVQDGLLFDASQVVPTAAENRPKNIAFNLIVRAA